MIIFNYQKIDLIIKSKKQTDEYCTNKRHHIYRGRKIRE
jgi:hypothetical protein